MPPGGDTQSRRELDGGHAFLATAPADESQRRAALWTVGISTLTFLAVVPFAKTPLAPVPAFIATYQSALAVSDLITAVLLFAQFSFFGARPLLLLAAGYLFTAFMAIAHALTFPGLFGADGLLGAGPQTTAWLYMFWHAGFPALVIAYAVLKVRATAQTGDAPASDARRAIVACVGAVAAATLALTFIATGAQALLPPIMQGSRYTGAMLFVVSSVWGLSALALFVLWRKRPHSVLDLWLMVVLCAWIFDVGLAAVFNGGRYDMGFYAGRLYGLLSACFVLVVLLVENGKLYGRLLRAYAAEQEERRKAQQVGAELLAANRELDAFSYSVSHDLRAPLRAIDGYARMLEEDAGPRLDEEGRRLLGVVRTSSKNMGRLIDDLLEFSRLGRQAIARAPVDMAELAREAAAELAELAPAAQVRLSPLPVAFADRALMKQVWHNLVGNALKYSNKRPDPRIEIGAQAAPSETVYWIRDNGAGFDMRFAGRLFGVFQRLHSEKEFPGTGVGLAIVQRIVARHGGRVWADAQPGAGATFYVALPATGEFFPG